MIKLDIYAQSQAVRCAGPGHRHYLHTAAVNALPELKPQGIRISSIFSRSMAIAEPALDDYRSSAINRLDLDLSFTFSLCGGVLDEMNGVLVSGPQSSGQVEKLTVVTGE